MVRLCPNPVLQEQRFSAGEKKASPVRRQNASRAEPGTTYGVPAEKRRSRARKYAPTGRCVPRHMSPGTGDMPPSSRHGHAPIAQQQRVKDGAGEWKQCRAARRQWCRLIRVFVNEDRWAL